jgi:hypothetical protein
MFSTQKAISKFEFLFAEESSNHKGPISKFEIAISKFERKISKFEIEISKPISKFEIAISKFETERSGVNNLQVAHYHYARPSWSRSPR